MSSFGKGRPKPPQQGPPRFGAATTTRIGKPPMGAQTGGSDPGDPIQNCMQLVSEAMDKLQTCLDELQRYGSEETQEGEGGEPQGMGQGGQ